MIATFYLIIYYFFKYAQNGHANPLKPLVDLKNSTAGILDNDPEFKQKLTFIKLSIVLKSCKPYENMKYY